MDEWDSNEPDDFKPGERVRCTDIDGDWSGLLELGQVYTILQVHPYLLILEVPGAPLGFGSRRARHRFVHHISIH